MNQFEIKPSIFIGSSVEGLAYAQAIHSELQYNANCTLWYQGVFRPSSNTINDLVDAASIADFAIFVFSPDDTQYMRGETHNSVRDNVLFEFGLFTGNLGKECVFYLKPMVGDIHIPTDLVGTTLGVYDSNRFDGNKQAAVGPFCSEVRNILDKWDISATEYSSESVTEFFPGYWENTWYVEGNQQGEEDFQIKDGNIFVVNEEERFRLEDIRINRKKKYIKFIRRGINNSDNRRLSLFLRQINESKMEGIQSDNKKIVFTRI